MTRVDKDVRKRISTQFHRLHDKKIIGSLRTINNYSSAFICFVEFLALNDHLIDNVNDHHISFNELINFTDREIAILYLNQLAINGKSDSWINMSRSAINYWMKMTLTLIKNGKSKRYSQRNIKKVRERLQQVKKRDVKQGNPCHHLTKSYTEEQMKVICSHVTARNAFSIMLCLVSGIRVHELLEIRRKEERSTTEVELSNEKKEARNLKFIGLQGTIYTVRGKGGLIREVLIPYYWAEELEKKRCKNVIELFDRGVKYYSFYDISGGNALSKCFSRASKKYLGWSTGIHSCRHDHAKMRLKTVYTLTKKFALALLIVSQELGHFRPQVSRVYLY